MSLSLSIYPSDEPIDEDDVYHGGAIVVNRITHVADDGITTAE